MQRSQENLQPLGELGDTPGILESVVLSNNNIIFPADIDSNNVDMLLPPTQTASLSDTANPGSVEPGTYTYKFVFADPSATTGNDEGAPSAESTAITIGVDSDINLTSIPTNSSPFTETRIYRQKDGAGDFEFIDTIPSSQSTYTDTTQQASAGSAIVDTSLDQVNYSYFITYYNVVATDLKVAQLLKLVSVPITDDNRRIHLQDLPTLGDLGANPSAFDQVRIYRNLNNQPENFYVVDAIDIPATSWSYIDNTPDSAINQSLSLNRNGPAITSSLELTNVSTFDGSKYIDLFKEGTLSFSGKRGTANLSSLKN